MLAYKAGYLDEIVGKEHLKVLEDAKVGVDSINKKDVKTNGEQLVFPNNGEKSKLSPYVNSTEQNVESESNVPPFGFPSEEVQGANESHVEGKSEIDVSDAKNQEGTVSVQEKVDSEDSDKSISADQKTDYELSIKGSDHMGEPEKTAQPVHEKVQAASTSLQDGMTPEEDKVKETVPEFQNIEGREEVIWTVLIILVYKIFYTRYT